MSVSFNPRVLIREVAPVPPAPGMAIEPLPSASVQLAQNIDFSKSLISSLEVEMQRLQEEKMTTEQALKAALARKREALIASATGGTGDSIPPHLMPPSSGNASARPTAASSAGALAGAAKAAWEKAIVEDEMSQPLKISADQLLKLTEEEREAERRLQAELQTHMQQLKQLRHKITEREGAAAAQAIFGAASAVMNGGGSVTSISPPRATTGGTITTGAANILNASGGMKSSLVIGGGSSAFRPAATGPPLLSLPSSGAGGAGASSSAATSPQRGDGAGAGGAPGTTTGAISRLEALEARIAQLEAGINGKAPLVVPMNALPPSRGALTPGSGRRRGGAGAGGGQHNDVGGESAAYIDGEGSVTAAGLYFDPQHEPANNSARPSTSAATAGNGKRSIMKAAGQHQQQQMQLSMDAGTGGATTPLPYSSSHPYAQTSSGLLSSMQQGQGGGNVMANGRLQQQQNTGRSVSFATLSKEVPLSVALLSNVANTTNPAGRGPVGPLPQPKAAKMPPPVTQAVGGGISGNTGARTLPALASAPVMGLVFQRERVRPGPNQPLTTQYTVMRAPGSTDLGLVDTTGSLASLQEYGRPQPKTYKKESDFDEDIGPSASQVLGGGGADGGDDLEANPTTNDAIDNWLVSKQQANKRTKMGTSSGARGGAGSKRGAAGAGGAAGKMTGPSPYANGAGVGQMLKSLNQHDGMMMPGSAGGMGRQPISIGGSGGAFKPVQQRAPSSSSSAMPPALLPPQQQQQQQQHSTGGGGFFLTGGDFGGPEDDQQQGQQQQQQPSSSSSSQSPSRSPSRGRVRTPPATRQPQMPIREAVARQKMELSLKPGATFTSNGLRYQPGAGAALLQTKTTGFVGRGNGGAGNQQATSSVRVGMRAAVKNATMAQFRELRENFNKSKSAIWSPLRGNSQQRSPSRGASGGPGAASSGQQQQQQQAPANGGRGRWGGPHAARPAAGATSSLGPANRGPAAARTQQPRQPIWGRGAPAAANSSGRGFGGAATGGGRSSSMPPRLSGPNSMPGRNFNATTSTQGSMFRAAGSGAASGAARPFFKTGNIPSPPGAGGNNSSRTALARSPAAGFARGRNAGPNLAALQQYPPIPANARRGGAPPSGVAGPSVGANRAPNSLRGASVGGSGGAIGGVGDRGMGGQGGAGAMPQPLLPSRSTSGNIPGRMGGGGVAPAPGKHALYSAAARASAGPIILPALGSPTGALKRR